MKWKALQAFKLENYIEDLEQISDKATKEWQNEQMLLKMHEDWKPLKFELKDWGVPITYILTGASVEDI